MTTGQTSACEVTVMPVFGGCIPKQKTNIYTGPVAIGHLVPAPCIAFARDGFQETTINSFYSQR